MAKTKQKYPVIELKLKDPNGNPVGTNHEVYLDGKKLPYVKSIKIEAGSREVTLVTLECYAYATAEVIGDICQKIIPLEDQSGDQKETE